MKRYFFTLPLLGLMLAASPGRAETQIGSWTMNISGTVLPSSCDVETTDQTVDLGEHAMSEIQTNNHSPWVNFTINVNCSAGTAKSAVITIEGQGASSNPAVLALDNDHGTIDGIAAGFGVVMQDAVTLQYLNLSQPDPTGQPVVAGENTLRYRAAYTNLNNEGEHKPGKGTAVAYFNISYE